MTTHDEELGALTNMEAQGQDSQSRQQFFWTLDTTCVNGRARRAVSSFLALAVCTLAFLAFARSRSMLPTLGGAVLDQLELKVEMCGNHEKDLHFHMNRNLSYLISIPSPAECCSKCRDSPGCTAWTWLDGASSDIIGLSTCSLKAGGVRLKVPQTGAVSGLLPPLAGALLHTADIEAPWPTQKSPAAASTATKPPEAHATHAPTTTTQEPTDPPKPAEPPVAELTIHSGVKALQLPQIGSECHTNSELPPMTKYKAEGEAVKVRVLSYNLYWWSLMAMRGTNGGAPFKIIDDSAKSMPYDLMAFQECEDPHFVLEKAGLLEDYTSFGGLGTITTAICMAFRRKTWELLSHGSGLVAEDARAQYYGKRAAQWMRLRHHGTGKTILFMNHHGPLPVNSGGSCGGLGTAYSLLKLIQRHTEEGDAVVLVGDFNANTGSSTVQHLERRLNEVFTGTALGGIDHFFTNLGSSSAISAENLGNGGSDHDALSVVLEMDGATESDEASSMPAAVLDTPEALKQWVRDKANEVFAK
eukprot:CAMPEP_0172658226 /NCGR_PEP_ID=MMETSP1074-20121228/2649_1 /TAXON_ID=2916 /ORGANISM="Ceratium fusus, Strain PA161109" /LENGTH=528 /DNA_ID=CAMNT_0013473491 /DNA_START=35 /DNA_END=1621 /DNA_ORIENTATION=-